MIRFSFFIFCLSACLPSWGANSSYTCEEVGSNSDKFTIPLFCILDSGEKIYYSYHAAKEDAKKNHKWGVFVFFNPSPEPRWDDMTKIRQCFPEDIASMCNFVILQPGLVSPKDFYPKMDPMMSHMADFRYHFPDLDLEKPCVLFVALHSGKEEVCTTIPYCLDEI
ncbi:hypothetical protein [Chlamydia vaughanii]|uniref:hypothetical protein n=1 Tax=Chlamydia vaughanii TaxID=3112552 RepID=UPI0032B2057C